MAPAPSADTLPDAANHLARVGWLFVVLRGHMAAASVPWVAPQEDSDLTGLHAHRRVPAGIIEAVKAESERLGVKIRGNAHVWDCVQTAIVDLLPQRRDGDLVLSMARLTLDLIRSTFASMQPPPPAILTLEEAADLMRIAPSTLKRWVCEGRIRKSVKGGKPIRFFRDLFVQEAMSEP